MAREGPVVSVDAGSHEEKRATRPSVDKSPGHDAPKSVSCVQKRRSTKRVSRLSFIVDIQKVNFHHACIEETIKVWFLCGENNLCCLQKDLHQVLLENMVM